jgi:MFS family permease
MTWTSQLARIIAAKFVRNVGFGLLSVGFALYLAARGLSPFAVGAVLTVALVAGAVVLSASPRMIGRFGGRLSLIAASVAMVIAGVLLGSPGPTIFVVLACLLGVLSAGGQEVGPFIAVEQLTLAESAASASAGNLFAAYNVAGAAGLALGALAAAVVPTALVPWAYACCGAALVGAYWGVVDARAERSPAVVVEHERRGRNRALELAALFGVDALAGGFVVQSFLAYWLHLRFGADQRTLGILFFAANTLSALSYPLAGWLSTKIGFLRTMVFTHLPSNVLLCAVPLMPTFTAASAVLLARFALSQLDVPTRQAFTMQAVPAEDRAYAAGLTNAVRPAAAAVAPLFAGYAVQTAAMGLPFFVAGGLKIVYDLIMFAAFRSVPTPEIASDAGARQ